MYLLSGIQEPGLYIHGINPTQSAESAAQEVTGMKMKMNMNMNIDVSEWTKRKIVRYIMTFMGAAAIAISIFG